MDAYRPRSRDRQYDSDYRPRDDRESRSDQGFQIRGRASRDNGPPGAEGYRRSPPRRQYYDQDRPHPPRERGSERYGRRNDDRYYRSDRSNGHHANEDHIDPSSYYDQPEEPLGSNGDDDVSLDEKPLQFLLIRGLKPNVDEALLSKGLEKLYLDPEDKDAQKLPPSRNLPGAENAPVRQAPSGAMPGSLKRVFVIRDRVTDKSMQFGFAEFHSIADAKAAFAKANDLGDKCTISSKQIAVDYPHLGVFPPVLHEQTHNNRFTFEVQQNRFLQYWDARYWASNIMVNADAPTKADDSQAENQKPTKKRPIATAANDALDGSGGDKPKKAKTGGAPLAMAQMWQKKQAELRGEDQDGSDDSSTHQSSTLGANHDSGIGQLAQSFVFEGERNGKQRKCCLLCGTELGATVGVADHVKRSEKHQQNLKDDAKYKQGFENLKKWGLQEDQTVVVQADPVQQPEYKDRAKERRKQEAKLGGSSKEKIKLSLKGAQGQKESSKPTPPSYGKGLNMLQKAGWKEGQGLGSGDGTTAPIEQSMYAAGVGLGHESSKKGDAMEEAARLTKDDRGSFLEKTKEVARERFERLG